MLSIGVLNAKGGVGKTMISTILAVRACCDFARVALVDLDPQQGSRRWWSNRGNPDNPTALAGESFASDAMEALRQTGWDVAIFDGAPGSLELTEDAIKTVDFVICPLKAADQDMASTEYVVSACLDFGKPFLLVINEAIPPRDKRAEEVRRVLERAGHPVAEATIYRRVPYVDAANVGKIASEIRAGRAAEPEIESLYAEVMKGAKAAAKKRERKAHD